MIGSAAGTGLLPGAPGTWGSLGTVLGVALLVGVEGVHEGLLPAMTGETLVVRSVALLAVLFVVGVVVGNRARDDWGRGDPGPFVLDEVVGQGLALLPLLPGPLDPLGLALAFGLFRLFDILKPPPCRRLEALKGGLGIMADDVMAGVYALALIVVIPEIAPEFAKVSW